jgi:hypothetical protein
MKIEGGIYLAWIGKGFMSHVLAWIGKGFYVPRLSMEEKDEERRVHESKRALLINMARV